MAELRFPDSLIDRLPDKNDAWLVFSACIFAIHMWSTIVFLYNFPSLIPKASIWQIISVLGFALVFALRLNTQFIQQTTWAWVPVIGLSAPGLFATLRSPVEKNRQNALAE
jgi:hypothetical protein